MPAGEFEHEAVLIGMVQEIGLCLTHSVAFADDQDLTGREPKLGEVYPAFFFGAPYFFSYGRLDRGLSTPTEKKT